MLVGTSGSKPSSSTGITNSASLPSQALTICVWARRICCNWFCSSAITSFLPFSISSMDLLMAPMARPSICAALSTSFSCRFFTSSYSDTALIFFSRMRLLSPSRCWIEQTVLLKTSKSYQRSFSLYLQDCILTQYWYSRSLNFSYSRSISALILVFSLMIFSCSSKSSLYFLISNFSSSQGQTSSFLSFSIWASSLLFSSSFLCSSFIQFLSCLMRSRLVAVISVQQALISEYFLVCSVVNFLILSSFLSSSCLMSCLRWVSISLRTFCILRSYLFFRSLALRQNYWRSQVCRLSFSALRAKVQFYWLSSCYLRDTWRARMSVLSALSLMRCQSSSCLRVTSTSLRSSLC